jgi:hypothetical protein
MRILLSIFLLLIGLTSLLNAAAARAEGLVEFPDHPDFA